MAKTLPKLYLVREKPRFLLLTTPNYDASDSRDYVSGMCVDGLLEHLPDLWCLPAGHYVEVLLGDDRLAGTVARLQICSCYKCEKLTNKRPRVHVVIRGVRQWCFNLPRGFSAAVTLLRKGHLGVRINFMV